jgi:hypothetical protein
MRTASLVVLPLLAVTAGCTEKSDARAPLPVSDSAPRHSIDADPLPSWHDGVVKLALVGFVARVTKPDSPDYVPPHERVAVFDNDGTLWVERPVPTQFFFTIDRVKELAPGHPAWRTQQPFAAVLDGDLKALGKSGERGVMKLMAATHTGNTTDEFTQIVTRWFETAIHPVLRKPYPKLAYLPMLELLAYLRSNGFSTYIVSGGGVEFIRPWSERVYGVPPERVIGSRVKLEYRDDRDPPVLYRLPRVDVVDDKAAKPVAIYEAIGRRPILAFGNSDGDYDMLAWTTSGPGPRLGLLLHHTDAGREFAYDRDAEVSTLARALDDAPAHRWIVVDMKRDWRQVFQSP